MFGIDLLDFFRSVLPWKKFDRLLGQLGGESRYAKALAEDDEVARQIVESEAEAEKAGRPRPQWKPSGSDWSMQHSLLADIRDLIGKAWFKDFAMYPRPENALERARQSMEEATSAYQFERILADVEAGKQRWAAGDRPVDQNTLVLDDGHRIEVEKAL